jgi:hypothetical protein
MRSTAVRVTPFHVTQAVRVAILARHADDLCIEIAAAGVLDAFDQRRLACFEDVASIEFYDKAGPDAAARRLPR